MAGPADIRIRPAPLTLRDTMVALCRETFAAHAGRQPYAFPKGTLDTAIGNIDAAFRDGRRTLPESPNAFAAMVGDEFAGYILLSDWARPNAPPMPYVCITDVAVVPAFRRQGVARKLIEHAKALAEKRGWDNLTAEVWSWNAASEALFQDLGFTRQSTTYRIGPDRQARDFPKPPGFWAGLGLWDRIALVALFAFGFAGAVIALRHLFRWLVAG